MYECLRILKGGIVISYLEWFFNGFDCKSFNLKQFYNQNPMKNHSKELITIPPFVIKYREVIEI